MKHWASTNCRGVGREGGNPGQVEKHQLMDLAARARAEKWAMDGAELVVGGRLGEGLHGVVLRGEWRGVSGRQCAIY